MTALGRLRVEIDVGKQLVPGPEVERLSGFLEKDLVNVGPFALDGPLTAEDRSIAGGHPLVGLVAIPDFNDGIGGKVIVNPDQLVGWGAGELVIAAGST